MTREEFFDRQPRNKMDNEGFPTDIGVRVRGVRVVRGRISS